MSTSEANRRLRLTRLEVRDFRGIDTLKLELSDAHGGPLDVVVFAGGNGSGKTAVLDAISLLLLGTPELLPKDRAPLVEQIRFGANKFELKADMRFVEGSEVVDFKAGIDGTLRDLDPARKPRTFHIHPDGTSKALIPGWGWTTSLAIWPTVDYFSARRDLVGLGQPVEINGTPKVDEGDRLRELKRRLISAYYRNLRTARNDGPASNTPIKRLQRFWERFDTEGRTLDVIPLDNNPGSGEEVVLRDARPIPEDITSLAMARKLAPKRTDIPQMVPLERLSSGQMELLGMAGPILFRDQPLDILLIDEPEHHLHVQWQRQLLSTLRELSPNTQIFVATHSEEILDSVLSYERFILVGKDDPRANLAEGEGSESGAEPQDARA